MSTIEVKNSRTGRANRGAKPGERRGGRQKGTQNKKTTSLQEKLTSHGFDLGTAMFELYKEAQTFQEKLLAVELITKYVQPVPRPVDPTTGSSEDQSKIQITYSVKK